jgi:hypothetical protein
MRGIKLSERAAAQLINAVAKLVEKGELRLGIDVGLETANMLEVRGLCIRAGDILLMRPWVKYVATVSPDLLADPKMYSLQRYETWLPQLLVNVLARFSREVKLSHMIREAVLWYVDCLAGLDRTEQLYKMRDVVIGEVLERIERALEKLADAEKLAESLQSSKLSALLRDVYVNIAYARQRLRFLLEAR